MRPIDDAANDPHETVNASLTSNSAYTLGARTSGTVTIADNDNVPTRALLPVRMVVANAAAAADGIIVNGRIISGESPDSARESGFTIVNRLQRPRV